MFASCSELTSVSVPKVVVIQDSAFYNCTKLADLPTPNGLIYIGHDAFNKCVSATSVNLPSSLVSIYCGAFQECTGLTEFVIPNSVTFINFYGYLDANEEWSYRGIIHKCTSLRELTIGAGITSLDHNILEGCDSIKKLIFADADKDVISKF